MAPAQLEKVFGTVLSTSSLKGTNIVNREGGDMGEIEEVMIDVVHGHVAFVVVSFGGVFGLGRNSSPFRGRLLTWIRSING